MIKNCLSISITKVNALVYITLGYFLVYVSAKKDLKIKQLTIIAEKITGDENCNMGRFLPFKKGANRRYVSPLSSECNKMVFFQDTTEGKRGVKKVVASWKAPKMNACTKVVLRLVIFILLQTNIGQFILLGLVIFLGSEHVYQLSLTKTC